MKNEYTNVDGKFYKKCEVVMLPTEKAEINTIMKYVSLMPNHIESEDGKIGDLVLNKNRYIHKSNKYWEAQHLYILSNEEIKEGDWIVRDYGLYQEVDKAEKHEPAQTHSIYKIIATTDESLKIKKFNSGIFKDLDYNLPKPSNEFLKKFCEVGGIWEMLVECEYNHDDTVPYPKTVEGCMYKLKVAPDNTITIKPIQEKLYTREEVRVNLQYCVSLFAAERGLTPASKEMKEVNDWINNWVKENL